MYAAVRAVTGCPISTPFHTLMDEAGLAPVAECWQVLAARLLAKASALPEGDPLHAVAAAEAPPDCPPSQAGANSAGRCGQRPGCPPPHPSAKTPRNKQYSSSDRLARHLTSAPQRCCRQRSN